MSRNPLGIITTNSSTNTIFQCLRNFPIIPILIRNSNPNSTQAMETFIHHRFPILKTYRVSSTIPLRHSYKLTLTLLVPWLPSLQLRIARQLPHPLHLWSRAYSPAQLPRLALHTHTHSRTSDGHTHTPLL